jgi:hypothetical protein
METLEITVIDNQLKEKDMASSIFSFKQRCNELKGKFMMNNPGITMDDLQCGNGNKEPMLQRLQQKLGKSSEELHRMIINLQ